METNAKIYIAGHKGLVGSAITRALKSRGFTNLVTRSLEELDLRDLHATTQFFREEQPEYIFLAAAKVGGIHANNAYPAEFIFDNLQIQNSVIHSAYLAKVKKLCFLGSSCIYPKHAPQPMKEEYLLDGKLEPTNEPYAIAKIAGIKMCQAYNRQYGTNFISVMPTNLYGQNDNFDLQTSHVLPAAIRKVIDARNAKAPSVTIWGSGTPRREFLHVDDMADACVYLMRNYNDSEIVNIGVGADISITELYKLICEISNFKGSIEYDRSKPDGTPQKLLAVGKINSLGWKARISLREGIQETIRWYESNRSL